MAQSADAGAFDIGANLVEQRFAATGGRHVGAGLRKADGQLAAETGRAADHDRHTAGKIHQVVGHERIC
jgi:hypothetical protein